MKSTKFYNRETRYMYMLVTLFLLLNKAKDVISAILYDQVIEMIVMQIWQFLKLSYQL